MTLQPRSLPSSSHLQTISQVSHSQIIASATHSQATDDVFAPTQRLWDGVVTAHADHHGQLQLEFGNNTGQDGNGFGPAHSIRDPFFLEVQHLNLGTGHFSQGYWDEIVGDPHQWNRLVDLRGGDHSMTFVGGSAGNDFTGNGGADVFIAGAGQDTFHYNAWTNSNLLNSDLIINFDPHHDRIDLAGIAGHGQLLFRLDAPPGAGSYAPDLWHLTVSDDPSFSPNRTIDIHFTLDPHQYADFGVGLQRQDLLSHVQDWLTG